MLLHNLLPIIVDLGILIIWFISFVGGFLYLISIIICLIKRKRLNDIIESKKTLKLFLVIVLIPILFLVIVLILILSFVIVLFKKVYLIHNSTLLLSYYSSGNGDFGDSNNFIYVISDKHCEEISFDVQFLYNYYNKLFLPSNLKEINQNDFQKLGYKIIIDDYYISVYKDNNLIHKKSINKKYYDIDLEAIYYSN